MKFTPSPNFRRKPGRVITAIVIHYTASMRLSSTIEWFKTLAARASAHYVVGRDGEIVQMVKDEDVAWHAGRSSMRPDVPNGDPRQEPNVNEFSLGIELVGTADSGFEPAQLDALTRLTVALALKYRVPASRVVGHAAIAPGRKIDPDGFHGQFDWDRFRAALRAAGVPD